MKTSCLYKVVMQGIKNKKSVGSNTVDLSKARWDFSGRMLLFPTYK